MVILLKKKKNTTILRQDQRLALGEAEGEVFLN